MVGGGDEQLTAAGNRRRQEIFRPIPPTLFYARRQFASGSGSWRVRPRRRKVLTIRLGGRGRRGGFLFRAFRQLRLGWLRCRATLLVKKLKVLYLRLLNDLVEAGAAMDSSHSRFFMDAYFASPMLPVSVPSILPSDGQATSSPSSRILGALKS
ncbi:uncharacterized protein LOC116259253 [Nymphaea colorata]|nr:uncharacterized protein LOC116259253 [Nymphaea colorata]